MFNFVVLNKTKQMDAKRKTFVELMRTHFGNVSDCCKLAKISRGTYYNWLKEDKEFKKEIDGIDEYLLDFVENALYKLIRKGDKAAIIFYMKTKGKHLGYVERQEVKNVDPPQFIMYDARGENPNDNDDKGE